MTDGDKIVVTLQSLEHGEAHLTFELERVENAQASCLVKALTAAQHVETALQRKKEETLELGSLSGGDTGNS